MTDILMKTENLDTETGTSCEVGGEISVMHLQVKGCRSLVANNQKLGERHRTDFPSHRSEGTAAAAAAAKSLQSCPTLCDPIDGSPPGSPVPGVFQARTPEWVAISFSNA